MRKIFAGLFILMTSLAFCVAEDYSNSLMGLDFEPVSNDLANIIVKTKIPYNNSISIMRKDSNTYVIMLPDTNSLAPNPDWSSVGKIDSVSIRTMPSSSSGKGYTKITVKTNSNINFVGKNAVSERIDIPENLVYRNPRTALPYEEYNRQKTVQRANNNNSSSSAVNKRTKTASSAVKTEKTEKPQTYAKPKIADESKTEAGEKKTSVNNMPVPRKEQEQETVMDKYLVILGIILVLLVSVFCYIRAKDKLTDIVGENLDIDVEDENKNKKKETSKKSLSSVKKTIKELDKKYPNPASIPNISAYSEPAPIMSAEKSTDDMNIVDLDALFNEHKTQEQPDENDALEDFLSNFDFEETNEPEQEENEPEELYEINEDEYNNVINNNNLKFTEKDIECIEQIINSDINSETLDNIEKYAATNPIKETPRQSLDELVAAYTISQNITFSGEDIKALDKLMRVELDDDFVNDLRTDPKRLEAMEKEIRDFENSERKKPGEIKTLKVADLLPNLSDVLANPSKYENDEVQKTKVDENALWKSIENVTFKPFDDGTRKFEILNDFDDEAQDNVIELYSNDFLKEKTKKNSDSRTEDNGQSRINELPTKNIQAKESQSNNVENQNKQNLKCIMNGKTYNVLSSIALVRGIGCHLAKSDDGYSVLSYSGNNVSLLKTYPSVNSSKIQARLSEKLGNGEYRFIIRIGNIKFVAELKNRCINYVMDL